MNTVVETPVFQKQAAQIWTEDERLKFISWIAQNPLAGEVIPNADGARKIRWAVSGKGKRGGARIIYFNQTAQGIIYLITVYQKSEQENILPDQIKKAI